MLIQHQHSEYAAEAHAHRLIDAQLRDLDARIEKLATTENVQRAINELHRLIKEQNGNDS